ncbi:ChrR Cupin-like domain protein [Pseudovibrio axinellae]|uniref:ChrR Cupin-like domain protein n=1 Tax=Pseudovibrio axinellae TaxID=989403 RepID=A0A161X8G2_9HYPH|nr:cupin domain-containing protein [Pseudovibrio axinellae]KZL05421.1 ChrR Cupin-like domain protein [Pseudovibrio axinellae]SEP99964.1 Anti-sigma factor ChrR, cupin superfamily [Pseudovibrio axinellae]
MDTAVKINGDFSKRVVELSDDIPWVESPMKGVERRPLDRLGEEVARATSVVRFSPGSHFSEHIHTGGEEFFVLEGVFQDEHGDFPTGSYIRNPPQSKHTPASEEGCTILVKLWQFDLQDRTHVRLDTTTLEHSEDPERKGVFVLPLFKDERECVFIERWNAKVSHSVEATGGVEIFVLEGTIIEAGEELPRNGWLRVPDGYDLKLRAGDEGAKLWIKSGHLRYVTVPNQ